MFPSNYIGAADLKGRDVPLTIAKIQVDDLMLVGGRKKKKPVVYFHGTEKMLVLNKTNALLIAGLHGTEMKAWAGKRILLFPTVTKLGKETVPCVRVREVVPPQKQSKPAAQPQPQVVADELELPPVEETVPPMEDNRDDPGF